MQEGQPKTVVLGVTGGIGAYKSCELARELVRRGHRVKVTMTEAATRFVAPLTFRTLSGEPVATSLWADEPGDPVHHISLAQEADVMVIAPCTANVLAKLAHGRADDVLTTTALATDAPLVLAPAMNDRMWLDEATQGNAGTMSARGAIIVGPDEGELACGDVGVGRLASVADIADAVSDELTRTLSMQGVRVLVTAGGTREPLDPVRFLGNRASGRTGMAVADEAARRGADVTVIAGATSVPEPPGCEVVWAETAQAMYDAVLERAGTAHVIVMTAAVADYRPVDAYDSKLKKAAGPLTLELERTDDILAAVGALPGDRVVVGFAAETEDLVERAREKLAGKGCELVVANDISLAGQGFGSETNKVVFVTAEDAEETELLTKKTIASLLLDRVSGLLESVEGAEG